MLIGNMKNTWTVVTEQANGTDDDCINVNADRINIDRGVLTFLDETGMILFALPAGQWMAVYNRENQNIRMTMGRSLRSAHPADRDEVMLANE
jgi:hypothetical protein